MSDTGDAVVRIQGVSHHYGQVAALRSVALEIPAGKMVGLIGPDGVGKSTLMGLIAGARKIQSGQVWVLGGELGDPTHLRAVCPQIAYMPQGLGKNLYFELSVFENIDFFARLFDQPRAERERRINGLLKATGLASRKRAVPCSPAIWKGSSATRRRGRWTSATTPTGWPRRSSGPRAPRPYRRRLSP